MPRITFNETAAGTAAGATATKAAAPGKIHKITHISGHTDLDSILRIEDEDTNILWQMKIEQDITGEGFSIEIPDGVKAPQGKAISGIIASSSADCQINISGFSVSIP